MLILSSCDFRNNSTKQTILNNLPKPINKCRLLFIPNEKATHDSILSGKYHARMLELGFTQANIYIFDHTCPKTFASLDLDVIYISGGNTFQTLQKLRKCGFDTEIIRYVRSGVTYIGGSAGAHIASTNIAHVAAFDDVPDDMTNYDGLGLFDGVLVCHYNEDRKPMFDNLKAESSCPVIALTDNDAVVI